MKREFDVRTRAARTRLRGEHHSVKPPRAFAQVGAVTHHFVETDDHIRIVIVRNTTNEIDRLRARIPTLSEGSSWSIRAHSTWTAYVPEGE
jgi:hypothetical protein